MTLKVKVRTGTEAKPEPQSSIKLQIRRNLAGDYMIFDHLDINIVVKPGDHKIVTMTKDQVQNSDVVYDTQNRLFKYLIKMGVVDPTTVKGGDLFGTLEAEYYSSDSKPNSTQVAIFMIGKFIEEERPYFIFRQAQEEIELERYYEPSDEESTELGEVPQAASKGTIFPNDFPSGANYRVYENKIKEEVAQLFTNYKGKK